MLDFILKVNEGQSSKDLIIEVNQEDSTYDQNENFLTNFLF